MEACQTTCAAITNEEAKNHTKCVVVSETYKNLQVDKYIQVV
ncbi:uncharacterized protein G2W53_004107 [Senna tora]|uniref:Uncharacterized protein n=1 Tax=Senna tora TaxID=362788 RepID=A0A834XBA7_9FABA|nr:uncharacterized protein G2W53_004107 [Senna tora]